MRDTGPFQGAALGGVEELVVVVGRVVHGAYEMTFKHFQDGTEGFIMGRWINYGSSGGGSRVRQNSHLGNGSHFGNKTYF